MLYNCKNLKILDIRNFYFNNLDSESDLSNGWIFFISGCHKLNFVNMKYCPESNLKNYQNIISNIKLGAKFCSNSNLLLQKKLIIDLNGIIKCPGEKNSSFENCIYYHYYDEKEKNIYVLKI